MSGQPLELTNSFPGMSDVGDAFGFSHIPPDPIMAAGPNHLMGLINSAIGIFDKSGTLQKRIDGTIWFQNVLPGLGHPQEAPLATVFDPKVIYDHFANRWVMVWLAKDSGPITESWILVSASDDADPNGAWCNWALRGDRNGTNPSDNWSDYQGLGFDDQAVYVVPNQINFQTDAFDYAKIRILPKATLYNTTCPAITWTDLWDLRFPQDGADLFPTFTVRPVTTFGTPGVLYLVTNSYFAPDDNNFMVLYSLRDPLTNPTLGADIVAVAPTFPPPNADQRDGSAGVEGCPAPCLIETGFPGLPGVLHNAVYRDGSVWTAHTVADNTGQFARARYVRIGVDGPTLLEDGSFGLPDHWYFYPAITAARGSNMAMVFSRSSKTTFAAIRYTTRLDGEDIGGSAVLKGGEANYVKTFGGSRNRWGDYNGIAVDPASPNRVWMFAEYAASPANTWGTWFGEVRFPTANTPPVADNQEAITDAGTPLPIVLVANDADADPLTYSLTSLPANGDLFEGDTRIEAVPHPLAGDTVLYTPGGVSGIDTFEFKVNDGTADSNIATVTITVLPLNTPPVAFDQQTATDVGAPVPIVLSGDDADADPLTFIVMSVPANGDLFEGVTRIDSVPHALAGDTVLYIPRAGFSGINTFEYRVNDSTADSNIATVRVKVGNTPPVADSEEVRTHVGVPLGIGLTGSDADGDPIRFSVRSVPANGDLFEGAAKIDAIPHLLDGQSVLYVPRGGFSGVDEFFFTVNDGKDDSEPAGVTITVGVVNRIPMADDQSVATDEDTPLPITLTGSDLDGDPLTFTIDFPPANGNLFEGASMIITPHQLAGDSVLYVPRAGFGGEDEFFFFVNDGNEDSPTARVTITVRPRVNTAPEAFGQDVDVTEGIGQGLTLEGFDADDDQLTFIITSLPTDGRLIGPGPIQTVPHTLSENLLAYLPDEGFIGNDGFGFKVNDGTEDSEPAIVNLTVHPAPVDEYTVRGTVELEGLPNPIMGARVTFSTNPTEQQVLTDPLDGSFEARLPGGTYNVTIEKDGFLPAMIDGLVVDRDVILEATLLWGDIDGNGLIDVDDLVFPAMNQGLDQSPPVNDVEPEPPPPLGDMIAFESDRDGNFEIYVMNADGTGQTRLTDHPAADRYPAWSPDGAMIAFTSTRDGNDEIYVMNADGTGQARLTNSPVSDSRPSWSPTGPRSSSNPATRYT